MKLLRSEITDQWTGCSYCGHSVSEGQGCCGEVHSEIYYEATDGNVYSEHEVEIVEDEK